MNRITRKAVEPPLTLARQQAILKFLEASQGALELGQSLEDVACPYSRLVQLGVSESMLRWLVAEGYALHRLETARKEAATRTFVPAPNLRFTSASCFFLSRAGVEVANRLTSPTRPDRRKRSAQYAPAAASETRRRDEPADEQRQPGTGAPHQEFGAKLEIATNRRYGQMAGA